MLATVPITLVNRAVTSQNGDGDDVYTDVPTVVQGIFAPGPSSERVQGQDQVTVQPTVYLPDMALTAVDAVIVLGVTYEVDGTPLNWPANPYSGWRPECPLEVRLRRMTG